MPAPMHERRAFQRHDLPCPISLLGQDGRLMAQARTVNVSDGGAYVHVPAHGLPSEPPVSLTVHLAVPRTTPNTYMLEDFQMPAVVVRLDRLVDGHAGVALRFVRPVRLEL